MRARGRFCGWWVRCAALLSVLLAAAGAAAADSPLDGRPITRIVVIRDNIFDPDDPATSAWPYRWANAIHVLSREDFVRSMLLFEVGDPYSQDAADESARILRSLGIMNPVEIHAAEVTDGVEVTVRTHDLWTLELNGKIGISGARSSQTFSILEQNFLGWGREIKVGWSRDNERRSTEYGAFDPNIGGSRWQARLEYADRSDGHLYHVLAERPFYALETSDAWGFEWTDESLVEHLYSRSETAVTGRHDSETWRLWGGLRLPGDGDVTRRVTAGLDWRHHDFEDWGREDGGEYAAPEDRTIRGVQLGYQRVAARYLVVTGFRAWTVQEDVALGPNLQLGVTASLPALGADRRRVLLSGSADVARHTGRWLLLGSSWLDGRLEDGGLADAVAGFELVAAQLGERGLQARLRVEGSHDLGRDRQLTLGSETGLRGWDPDHFDGTGSAVLNLQWRRLVTRDLLGLVAIGVVGFVDAGYTWGPRVGPGTGRVRVDSGIGAIVDLTKVGTTNLVRIDVAVPDDGGGLTVTVSSAALF